MYSKLKLDLQGHVATLELCDPDSMNAFGEDMHEEFADALQALRSAPDIRAILLSAQGKAFSAGGSFDYIRKLHHDAALRRKTQREGTEIIRLLQTMHVPTIAAVQGHAVGVGATIITSCDIVVAYKDAKIGDPHVLVGMAAGDGGVIGWSASAGVARAKRMLLTGETITAKEAHGYGLISDIVDAPEQAVPEARRIADKIASLSPVAVQATKGVFNALGQTAVAAALDVGILSGIQSLTSTDLLEALDATAEKRAPLFRNE
jgi:enoyl-CoA hydratase